MVATVSRGRGRRTINEINMVPFIDVMLVLLIIFMVTAPLISPSVIDLPTTGKASKQADTPIHIMICPNKTVEFMSNENCKSKKGIALDNIADFVIQKQNGNPKTPVVINADKTVEYQTVVTVLSKLQTRQIERVGLSVRIKQ
jgi:biopolymer transport protein TolR